MSSDVVGLVTARSGPSADFGGPPRCHCYRVLGPQFRCLIITIVVVLIIVMLRTISHLARGN